MSSCYILISLLRGCLSGVMYIFVDLAGISLLILTSYDRKRLTERVVLQASLGVVRCIERLIFARRKEMGGRDTIDYTLKERRKVVLETGVNT